MAHKRSISKIIMVMISLKKRKYYFKKDVLSAYEHWAIKSMYKT